MRPIRGARRPTRPEGGRERASGTIGPRSRVGLSTGPPKARGKRGFEAGSCPDRQPSADPARGCPTPCNGTGSPRTTKTRGDAEYSPGGASGIERVCCGLGPPSSESSFGQSDSHTASLSTRFRDVSWVVPRAIPPSPDTTFWPHRPRHGAYTELDTETGISDRLRPGSQRHSTAGSTSSRPR
jgi:hypothetical protein